MYSLVKQGRFWVTRYKTTDNWTTNPSEATQFRTASAAYSIAITLGLDAEPIEIEQYLLKESIYNE